MTRLFWSAVVAALVCWSNGAFAQTPEQKMSNSIGSDAQAQPANAMGQQIVGDAAGTRQFVQVDAAGNLIVVAPAGAPVATNIEQQNAVDVASPIAADTGAGTTNYIPVIVRTPGAAGTGLDGVAVRSSTEAVTSTGGSLEVTPIAGQDGIAGGTGLDAANVPRVSLVTNVGLPAGASNIGDVDILVGGAAATANTGLVGANTIRVTVATDDVVTVDNGTLSVVGTGLEATALRVTVASDSTGVLSVDDNGGTLTVDAPVGTPVFVRQSDGVDAANVSAAGGLQVDGSGVTQPVSGTVTANAGTGNFANNLEQLNATDLEGPYDENGGGGFERVLGVSIRTAGAAGASSEGVILRDTNGTGLTDGMDDGELDVDSNLATLAGTPLAGPVSPAIDNNGAPGNSQPVAGFNLVFDGATWDRQRGNSTEGTFVGGPLAHGAAVPSNPQFIGAYAETDGAALDSAGVAEADITRLKADQEGQLQVRDYHPNRVHCVSENSTATGLTIPTTVSPSAGCGAPGASLSIYVTDVTFSSSAAAGIGANEQMQLVAGTQTTTVCDTGPVILWSSFNAANDSVAPNFRQPLKLPANNQLCWRHAIAGSKSVVVQGFIAP